MFKEIPEKVVYCYTAWQKMFDDMKENVHFHKGPPSQGMVKRTYAIIIR